MLQPLLNSRISAKPKLFNSHRLDGMVTKLSGNHAYELLTDDGKVHKMSTLSSKILEVKPRQTKNLFGEHKIYLWGDPTADMKLEIVLLINKGYKVGKVQEGNKVAHFEVI